MPRRVPFCLFIEMLHSVKSEANPCRANSSADQLSAKKPRSSVIFSSSITKAPVRLVSLKIISYSLLRNALDDPKFWDWDDKTTAVFSVLCLLVQYFVGKVPCEQQNIIGHFS